MHHHTLPEYGVVNGVNVYRVFSNRKLLNMSGFAQHVYFLINARKLLLNVIVDKKRYDFCHCHFLIPTGILALWLKAKYNLPYIVTIHGSDIPGYNPDRFQLIHKFTKPLLSNIVRQSSAIISPSFYLADLLKRSIPNSLYHKISIIRYCYQPIQSAFKKEKIILSTGRLLKRKGFHTLIKAVSGKDIGYEVHILGDGPMMNELKQMATQSKTKIILHGWMNNQSSAYLDLLSKAEIFCLVSSHENSSLSIMEAMDHECAIITSDQTGTSEMINDVGICIPYDNEKLLSESIQKLIENPTLINSFGKNAKQKLTELFHPERVYQSYLDVIAKHGYE